MPELRACHTLAEALRKRGRVVPLPPSATSTHLPPLFLSAGGQALVCLLAGMRSLRRRSWAFLPTRFLLSQAPHIKSQAHSVIFSYLFLNHPPAPPSVSLKFLRLLLPWNSNNLRDEGSLSMVSAKLPKLQRLKSAQTPRDFPTLSVLQSEESYI